MQTFLPYVDFTRSAQCLDTKRLVKQIVECQQIFNALLLPEAKGWKNHPAVTQWKGYESSLLDYMAEMVEEYFQRFPAKRGNSKSWNYVLKTFWATGLIGRSESPHWLGNPELHASHRANLLRKDPTFYGTFGWTEEPREGYIWGRDIDPLTNQLINQENN